MTYEAAAFGRHKMFGAPVRLALRLPQGLGVHDVRVEPAHLAHHRQLPPSEVAGYRIGEVLLGVPLRERQHRLHGQHVCLHGLVGRLTVRS
jgi:hypothetical protein